MDYVNVIHNLLRKYPFYLNAGNGLNIGKNTTFSFCARVTCIFVGLLMVLSFSSCVNTKKTTYFNQVSDSVFVAGVENLEPIIKKNDLLSIQVSSLSSAATEIFNVSNISNTQTSAATGNSSQTSGYLVDQDGFISFPLLGKVKAEGKTKKELSQGIKNELESNKLLVQPIVDIRYLNYKVSILGEVSRPAVLTIANEKVTLLEALGLAGDMTIYAKRDNVLLIRVEDSVKRLIRIDLTTDEIFTSPYYYLQSNDIVYVQPNKSKIASTRRVTLWLPVIISSLSLAIIAFDVFTR